MTDAIQIPFHQKRRQHFLSEQRWIIANERFVDALDMFQELKQSTILDEQQTLFYEYSTLWEHLKLNYTAGMPIDNLPPILDEIIKPLQNVTIFWQENRKELRSIGFYSSPMPWYFENHYLTVLGLISLCYLLHREDLLPQLLQIIIDNDIDDLGPDSTIEDFFHYRFKDRTDPDYIQMNDHAVLISDAIREKDPNEKKALLHQYLKKWYKEMVGMNDLEYNSHLDPEQNGYCGYWAFEAAAIAYLDEVDDTEFYQYPYYPKDMVEWAREQRRIRYAEQDSESQHPLLLSVGQQAPFSGKYGVDNFSGFERYFQAGDVLPNGQVSGKRDEKGNPVFRQDAIWRLLSRDDGGTTRFTEDELNKYHPDHKS
ncbi:PoNe immunity protein domain-containing protein [Wielerella bovis]|uniref:PoNe immunity protein domain-containing protein n=1 Tax=Wielerella bovis TaxID=2917790 RepID=UPI0020192648|nr:PoNe immunity protein domain-containing protein [Wielerella bovis]ULJ61608.1 DUF1911 domain-containing protein [Wielerella bovis]ULJ64479.1 DUF1911 domain-containing protein [Wielerella bovis]ULJ66097.1 DUF1911 domain-containing protein [Wielerella bovis]